MRPEEGTTSEGHGTRGAKAVPFVAGRTGNGSEPQKPARPARESFTIEQAGAIESPREFRLSPDGRRVAYTAEAAGARQVFLLSLRGGYPEQLTASEKNVSDPQWSPDGRRIAFAREDAIVMIEIEGSRQAIVTAHPAGNRAPRWSPDGHRIAFISRRRGWDQLWLVDAPVPRRGRPASKPRPAEPRPLTPPGADVDEFTWSPDGTRIAIASQRSPDLLTAQVHVLEVATGRERLIAGDREWATGPRWLRDGSGLLLLSDADGWFQVLRVDDDGSRREQLTFEPCDHGDTSGGWGYVPLPSPDGSRFLHATLRDGLTDIVMAPLPAEGADAAPEEAVRLNPTDGVWMSVDWLPDGSGVLAIGESDRQPEDLWLLPVPGASSDGARPRQLTHTLPAVVDTSHFAQGTRVEFRARDGLPIAATLWLPQPQGDAAVHVPCVVQSHGGPTSRALRDWTPFRELVVEAGMAYLSVDFRGSTGYGREFRWANRGEWGHADAFDVIDAAHWAASQPWCDGRLAHFGGSYGGYLTLCVLVEEPELWRCGIDLYGDSEIAESYRHGDRVGRIDLERMMGRPDDEAAAATYRRGSPLYRAERLQAPLLIMHGRKDKRVVPLMSEKMIEALEIEGKHYQVQWYDDEGHGWQRRENRRDAWKRSIDFLRRHLLEQADAD